MPQVASRARTIELIHRSLTTGCLLAAGGVVYVRRLGETQSSPEQATIGIVLAVTGLALLVVAAAFLRPRLPERTASQTADAYWEAPETVQSAMVLWAIVEGAAIASLVGYWLTGGALPAGVAGLAIITLVVFRPTRIGGVAA